MTNTPNRCPHLLSDEEIARLANVTDEEIARLAQGVSIPVVGSLVGDAGPNEVAVYLIVSGSEPYCVGSSPADATRVAVECLVDCYRGDLDDVVEAGEGDDDSHDPVFDGYGAWLTSFFARDGDEFRMARLLLPRGLHGWLLLSALGAKGGTGLRGMFGADDTDATAPMWASLLAPPGQAVAPAAAPVVPMKGPCTDEEVRRALESYPWPPAVGEAVVTLFGYHTDGGADHLDAIGVTPADARLDYIHNFSWCYDDYVRDCRQSGEDVPSLVNYMLDQCPTRPEPVEVRFSRTPAGYRAACTLAGGVNDGSADVSRDWRRRTYAFLAQTFGVEVGPDPDYPWMTAAELAEEAAEQEEGRAKREAAEAARAAAPPPRDYAAEAAADPDRPALHTLLRALPDLSGAPLSALAWLSSLGPEGIQRHAAAAGWKSPHALRLVLDGDTEQASDATAWARLMSLLRTLCEEELVDVGEVVTRHLAEREPTPSQP